MKIDLTPIWMDIPVAFAIGLTVIVATVAGGIRLGRHIRNPRPDMPRTSHFALGAAFIVALFGVGCFTGRLWLIAVPFVLVVAWCFYGFANTTAAIHRGDEYRQAGLYPPWQPWTCPVHGRDCRKPARGAQPCEKAEALMVPRVPRPTRPPEEW